MSDRKKKHRQPYPSEFREQMVALVRAGRTPDELAAEFEPTSQTIRNWVRQADVDEGRRSDGLTSSEREELRRLRREVKNLRIEREILGRADLPVTRLCEMPGLSTSGDYGWLKRAPSKRARADEGVSQRIGEIHEASRATYGVPRVHAELRAEGTRVSRKRVARLMRERGIQGVTRRKGFKTTRRGRDRHGIPDLVERNFAAEAPNRLWVGTRCGADHNHPCEGRVRVPGCRPGRPHCATTGRASWVVRWPPT